MPELEVPIPRSGGTPHRTWSINEDEAQEALDDERVLAWHDHVVYEGVLYPVLWYTTAPGYRREQFHGGHLPVRTEPCIWCGHRHQHGDVPGSRVPHCGQPHTHDRTVTGRPRLIHARGVTPCTYGHRDYVLMRDPRPSG